jgi:subtilisin family serine protease
LTRAFYSSEVPKPWLWLALLSVALLVAPSVAGRADVQTAPTWGLDAIDQRGGTDGLSRFDATGAGVNLYIVDTGVRTTHQDFRGPGGTSRATYVGDFCSSDSPNPSSSQTYADGYDGHGTHNASYAAGTSYGVARGATILALRAAGPDGGACSRGNPAATTRALNWIVAHGRRPGVVNISFAFADDPTLDRAILDAIAAGFVVTLSAGTGGAVESHWGFDVPGQALVVGGVDNSFHALGTDRGPALALWAPAKGLAGAGLASDSAVSIPEDCCGAPAGDSFAAPFVAGVAALFLQRHPRDSPADVRTAIVSAATPNIVRMPGTSPNRFLFATLDRSVAPVR